MSHTREESGFLFRHRAWERWNITMTAQKKQNKQKTGKEKQFHTSPKTLLQAWQLEYETKKKKHSCSDVERHHLLTQTPQTLITTSGTNSGLIQSGEVLASDSHMISHCNNRRDCNHCGPQRCFQNRESLSGGGLVSVFLTVWNDVSRLCSHACCARHRRLRYYERGSKSAFNSGHGWPKNSTTLTTDLEASLRCHNYNCTCGYHLLLIEFSWSYSDNKPVGRFSRRIETLSCTENSLR